MTRSLLVTGCTGTFGRAFIRRALASQRWDRVVGLSRDELKQAAIREEFGADGPRLFLGCVRDLARMTLAMRGVDTVVHAAALKRVDAGAYSPSEMVATNVLGTMNVIDAAIANGASRVVVLSSDKSVCATNIYGASKYMAECHAISANSYGASSGTRIAAVRYGNILGSRGSVVDVWRRQAAYKVPLTVTDAGMSRFAMTIEQATELVEFALEVMQGGEVFLPILPSMRMTDLAAVIGGPDAELLLTGTRPGGEKMAEALLNEEEPGRTRLYAGRYVIAPSSHEWVARPRWPGTLVDPRLTYRSDTNHWWLSRPELWTLLAGTETMGEAAFTRPEPRYDRPAAVRMDQLSA